MKTSYLKSGAILSYTAIAVQSLISILYTPVMLRLLGKSNYGLLELAVSSIAHLGILSFGFSGSYLRFYTSRSAAKDKTALASLNGMYAAVFACVSLLALIAGGVITAFTDKIFAASMTAREIESLRLLLGIMTVNLALSFPCSIFDAYITAHEKFVFQKTLVILTSFMNPLFTLPLLLIGKGSAWVAVCMTLITLIKLATGGFYCIRKLGMKFIFRFEHGLFKELFSFSFFVFLNIVSDQINWGADKTILGIAKGADEVTLYSLGAQFNTYFLTLSYALSALFTPKAYKIASLPRANRLLNGFFARYGKLQLTVMGYIFLMLVAVGRPFMRLWSGLDTDVPYYVALLLISPILITSTQSIGIEIQRAKDLHRFRSILYLAIALANIAISIPLCMVFGPVGCAAGTCGCLVVGNIIIMNIYYHKRVGLDMFAFWREISRLIPALTAPAVCAAVCAHLCGNNLVSLIAGGAALSLVYAASIWFLSVKRGIIKK